MGARLQWGFKRMVVTSAQPRPASRARAGPAQPTQPTSAQPRPVMGWDVIVGVWYGIWVLSGTAGYSTGSGGGGGGSDLVFCQGDVMGSDVGVASPVLTDSNKIKKSKVAFLPGPTRPAPLPA
jgi:hypothetical protein